MAQASDMGQIHDLVKELALFEKAPKEVTTTPQMYERDLNDGVFECIVAEEHDRILGIALYYIAYSTWKGKMLYLEDFVVARSRRGQGIGKLLFDALIDKTKSKGIKRIKWQVLDWNVSAIDFYKKYNATFDRGWWNGNLFFLED